MAEKRDNVAVKYKDNVFCMLYRDKKNLLELYNALNNSNYTNVDDLKVTTLNGGSYMKYKNDASFLLSMNLYMFEQQSSRNNNMALRFLHYVSDVFRELFSNDMLHRRSMIKIPVPHFVTFYNGLEKWIDKEGELKLSDMYEIPVDNPQLELKVRVININKDADILSKCKTLRDYMTFVNKVRYKTAAEREDVKLAVLEAMDECIEENILVDFFEKHREEVVEVSIYDYDEEKVRKTLVDEAVKEAVEETKREDRQLNMINLIIKKVKKEKTLETIASELEENVEDIRLLYDTVKEASPEYDVDKIMKKLNKEND
ncbi:MAG: hypothetical protein Q4E78_09830 [Eubacteriales bacterium]|nr:hypothetical protein [Eubacteriales bacterium]